jgi:hypothetical protein
MKAYILFFLLLTTPGVFAQQWGHLNDGLPSDPYVVYGDSTLDKLIIGGRYVRIVQQGDSTDLMGVATWDGVIYDSLASRLQTIVNGQNIVGPIQRFLRYNGELYVCGGFGLMYPDSTFINSVARLNENTMRWEPLECDFLGGIFQLADVAQNTLYFTGDMDMFCDSFPESCVVGYDGASFYPYTPFADLPYYYGNYVGYVFHFQGQDYMTGLITTDTVNVEFYGLMRYTGTEWEPVPGFETAAPIKKFLIDDNKLYVSGYFRAGPGVPGNSIAMFDGVSWSDLGGGMLDDLTTPSNGYPIVYDMLMHHGDLVAVGDFMFAGDIAAQNIAKWNGYQWCSYGGDFGNQVLTSVTTWRDTLYISGTFQTIDGVPYGYVARWEGGNNSVACSTPTSVMEYAHSAANLLRVVPNPATGSITIQCGIVQATTVLLLDPLGRAVLSTAHDSNGFVTIEHLTPACYTVLLLDASGQAVARGRFIKD